MMDSYPLDMNQIQTYMNKWTEENKQILKNQGFLRPKQVLNSLHCLNKVFLYICKINLACQNFVDFYADCIENRKVITFLPMDKIQNFELLFTGTPPNFVLVMPYPLLTLDLDEKHFERLALEIMYHLFYVHEALRINQFLTSQGLGPIELNDFQTQIGIAETRLKTFKIFWENHSQDFFKHSLPVHLAHSIYN
ncbi:MAG: hypothetical protein ACRCXZ_04360 [Patescibacteria group bacterium]